MTPDKQEVAIAVLQERMEQQMKTIFNLLEKQGVNAEKLAEGFIRMEGRMGQMEEALAKAQPTLDSYISVQHKIEGAGMAGKYFWAVATAVLSAFVFFREAIVNWITK